MTKHMGSFQMLRLGTASHGISSSFMPTCIFRTVTWLLRVELHYSDED